MAPRSYLLPTKQWLHLTIHDVQFPKLTVQETVIFYTHLRLEPKVVETNEEKLALVGQCLEELGLLDPPYSLACSDVGIDLSFEQKKRISIAVELSASPSVLCFNNKQYQQATQPWVMIQASK